MVNKIISKKRLISENSLKNLIPIKPGEVRNPKGRTRKIDCLLSCIKEELAKLSINKVSTREQLIAAALVGKAEAGDIRAIELCLEYTVAKPKTEAGIEIKGGFKVLWDGNKNATEKSE